ncbi:hypothetical protein SAMN05443249_4968 [Beijerinckia sp. 28-YEA-48]|nr:hypothetical protein SAMN05443249_4968 [Beijerinckia sp. 28-YEA-48]
MLEAQIFELQRRETELERQKRELMSVANEYIGGYGKFVELLASKSRRLEEELALVRQNRLKLAVRLLDEARRLKLFGRLRERVEVVVRRQEEAKDLNRLIDLLGAKQAARLP